MAIENFYATRNGLAPLDEGGDTPRSVRIESLELGQIAIPSRQVGVSDGLVLSDGFDSYQAPQEFGKVVVTRADVSSEQNGSHMREAYLSLIFSDEEPVSLEKAIPMGLPATIDEGFYYSIPVDAGTVSFFDAEAMKRQLARLEDDPDGLDEQFENWLDALDEGPLPAGLAMIHYPDEDSDDVIAISRSGWGDGYYPVMVTLDKLGELVGIHVDLQVVGLREEIEMSPPAPETVALEEKLLKEMRQYGSSWPAFLAIGIAFVVLGIQNLAFLAPGIAFLVLSFIWSSHAVKAQKQLVEFRRSKTSSKKGLSDASERPED